MQGKNSGSVEMNKKAHHELGFGIYAALTAFVGFCLFPLRLAWKKLSKKK